MKTFLTPLQYNEIFSPSTNIVINGSVSEEKSYLLDKCKSLEAKLQVAVERLGGVTRQLNCPYSHTSFGEDFHCNKCGFTKIINSGDER